MIDLQGPIKRSYSKEEEVFLQEKFILMLHSFLLFYLVLHNLVIPIVSNVLRSGPLISDVHFWFLAQLPVHWFLKKKRIVPFPFYLFLIVGSLTRILIEFLTMENYSSWTLFSVGISEFSSFIFYFVLFPFVENQARSLYREFLFSSLAIGAVLLLSSLELKSSIVHKPFPVLERKTETTQTLGCEGSSLSLNFPLKPSDPILNTTSLVSCGFQKRLITFDQDFLINNELSYSVNLRLYKLHFSDKRPNWRFVRLVQVGPKETWTLSPYFKQDYLYLLKSPERKQLGHLVLIPKTQKPFPMGEGSLDIKYDTIRWIQKDL